jgi:hypothetical protein
MRNLAVFVVALTPSVCFADFDMARGNDTAIIAPVCLYDSTTGNARITNVASEDSGLKITLAYEDSDTPLVYDATGEIEPITTARTWAAPTASNVRFEVGTDGCYELQFAANSFETGNSALLVIEDTSSPTFAAREVRIHYRATGTDIQGYANAALVANRLDHLMLVDMVDADCTTGALCGELAAASGDFADFDLATDSLEAQHDHAVASIETPLALMLDILVPVRGVVGSATITSVTSDAVLTESSARSYVGMTFYWPAGQQTAKVLSFDPATDTVYFDSALSAAPSVSDPFYLIADPTQAGALARTTVLTVTSQLQLVLAADPGSNDWYNNFLICIDDVSAGLTDCMFANDYVTSSDTLILERAAKFTVAVGDVVRVLPVPRTF